MEDLSADDRVYLEAVAHILVDLLQRLGPHTEARFEFFRDLVRLALDTLEQEKHVSN